MELAPCGACRRHVAAGEVRCPFCGSTALQRPQRAMPRGRLTRAAIFSAALVACESSPEAPRPAPSGPVQGSDDLEKLLDVDQRVVDRPPPVDAMPADAASHVASSPPDAGRAAAPIDAGVDPLIAERRRRERERRERERRERDEQLRREQEEQKQLQLDDMRHHAKPYGAPPARRRVV